jgi:hypothetical protein
VKTHSSIPFGFAWALVLATGLVGCNAERVTSGPSATREQEVLRLRARDTSRAPIVFGQVQVVNETGRFPLPTALVSVDGKPTYTNETGTYRLVVAPGSHQFLAGQTGMRQARATLKVELGDSVRLNFYLRPDTRP